MAIGDTYVDLAELKSYLQIDASKTSLDDALTSALESASSEIERHCNRQFNKATAATPRVYAPTALRAVEVDDFWTTTDLVVEMDTGGDGSFSTVVPSTDYELYPYSGVVDGQPGWPYYKLRLVGGTRFPTLYNGRRGTVRVTAQWGWDTVPAPVQQACLIIAAETFQLKDAPFGVAGMDQFGSVFRVRDNRMAAAKLARYVRNRVMVG